MERSEVSFRLVEASDGESLTAGMQGLAIRLARAVNRVVSRRVKVWAERYHRHDLGWRRHRSIDPSERPRRAEID